MRTFNFVAGLVVGLVALFVGELISDIRAYQAGRFYE